MVLAVEEEGRWGRSMYQVVEDFVPKDADHLEGLLGSNGIDEHVAMDADEVLGVQDAVFVLERGWAGQVSGGRSQPAAGRFGMGYPWRSAYLPRGVDYFCGKVLTFVFDDATERVFDCRIVAFHKVPIHKLHRQGGFACQAQLPRVDRRTGEQILTDRSAAHNGHLPLLGRRRHGHRCALFNPGSFKERCQHPEMQL